MTSKVLLTGASGFIAAHILKVLLDRGYSVVATVRSQSKADAVAKLFSSHKDRLSFELVPEIQTEGAFDKAFQNHQDIKWVLHSAAPVGNVTDGPEKGYLRPAIDGAVNILHAAQKYGPNVERVIFTSSLAAHRDLPLGADDSAIVYTENLWSTITYEQSLETQNAYRGSKKLAEEAFWNFFEENKVNFTGTAISPPLVFGPPLFDSSKNEVAHSSNRFLYDVISSKPGDKVENDIGIHSVDVRDVAEAHALSIEKKEAIGQRWLLGVDVFTPYRVLKVLHKNFPQLEFAEVPADYNEEDDIASRAKFDTTKTAAQSGITYRPFEETIVDATKRLLELQKNWD